MKKERIERLLANHPGKWWTPREVSMEADCSDVYAYIVLRKMYKAGDVNRTERFIAWGNGSNWGVTYQAAPALVRRAA